jgi:hypothetical protein
MKTVTSHVAVADTQAATAITGPAAAVSPFTIEDRFMGGLRLPCTGGSWPP